MRTIILAAAAAAASISSAAAHPGPKLLIAGSEARTAMTQGVSYEEIDGLHLFKGAPRLAGEGAAPSPAMGRAEMAVTIVHQHKRRNFRRLRTQGFYSGTCPHSRRYTQGFYSGD